MTPHIIEDTIPARGNPGLSIQVQESKFTKVWQKKYSAVILCIPNSLYFHKISLLVLGRDWNKAAGGEMTTILRYFALLLIFMAVGCASQLTAENNESSEISSEGSQVADNDLSEGDPDEMICRREQVTGSNFRRRVCMTRAERQREQENSQEELIERRSSVRGITN